MAPRAPRGEAHLDAAAVLDSSRAALSGIESDVEASLVALAGALEPTLCDVCEVEVVDDGAVRRFRVGGEVGVEPLDAHGRLNDPAVAELRDRVRRRSVTEVTRTEGASGGSVVVVPLLDVEAAIGTITCVTRGTRTLDEDTVAVVEGVGRAAGASIGRMLLHRRARDAVRASQRIASQLHQLISTSITVAGLRSELEVVETVAARVRDVFDGDDAVVSLLSGPASPLCVATSRRARRARALDREEVAALALPEPTPSATPFRDGDWLVAPVLARRGASRGSVCVRRATPFSEEDVEVAALLAQMAASALDAAELNRSILRSEERLRVLVEAAPVGIVETDLDGRIEWWNPAAGALFAWPVPEEATPGEIGFPAGVLGALVGLWAAAADGAVVTGHDLAGIEVEGRRRDLAASVALLPATPGRSGSLLTLVEDVTDHRQLMEELRHAQRMEVIGQLSSSVAHDFNNLLTLIAGYAELLTLESVDEERTLQLARDIQATTTRASSLTGTLLTMGRSKTPTPVVFSPVAVVGAIAEVLDRILGADVRLSLDLDAEAGAVRTDQDQFEQMVMNLATNARDAMEAGGELRIAIERTTLDAAAAGRAGVEPGDYVRLSVADTGEGMDDETLQRCFEPLFTTKGPSKGTGLGLPAARRVVVESGGTIDVRSVPGEGTTFEILLPLALEAVVEHVAADEPPVEVVPATVLLAEDEDGIRQLVSRVLRRSGHEVLEAESAERALEVARATSQRIDVLVSDVVMAEMSGTELAATLQHERPGLLVVLVSGNVDASALDVLEAGSGAFLAKPFRPSELLEVLSRLREAHDPAEART